MAAMRGLTIVFSRGELERIRVALAVKASVCQSRATAASIKKKNAPTDKWGSPDACARATFVRLLILLQWVLKVVIEAAAVPTLRPFLCPRCHVQMTVVDMTPRLAVVT